MNYFDKDDDEIVRLVLVEQPSRSGARFRYQSEPRPPAFIHGCRHHIYHPTYPTVRICDYSGNRAMIVVSCVTVDEPFRQHPNHLVGHHNCRNGVYIDVINNFNGIFELKRCGIQLAKRSQIKNRLQLRREMGCDPTNGGFDHIEWSPKDWNLKACRLCFQLYIEEPITGLLTVSLSPVVSDPVYDQKFCPSLVIRDISRTCCPMSGAKVMLFCNQIDENDIEVVFYQTDSYVNRIWKILKSFELKIWRKHFVSFKIPAIYEQEYSVNVTVMMQLRRLSDKKFSQKIKITYLSVCDFESCKLAQLQTDIDMVIEVQRSFQDSNSHYFID